MNELTYGCAMGVLGRTHSSVLVNAVRILYVWEFIGG